MIRERKLCKPYMVCDVIWPTLSLRSGHTPSPEVQGKLEERQAMGKKRELESLKQHEGKKKSEKEEKSLGWKGNKQKPIEKEDCL